MRLLDRYIHRDWSFSSLLLIYMIVLLVLIVLFFTANDVLYARNLYSGAAAPDQGGLERQIVFHSLIAVFAVCFGCLTAIVLTRNITRPIRRITEDVDLIAHGQLQHRISSTRSREFAGLESSINTMIDALNNATRNVRDSEALQREMLDQLPVAVFVKRISDGRYVYWNQLSEKMFGIRAQDIIDRTDRELFSSELADIFEKQDFDAIRTSVEINDKVLSSSTYGGRITHTIITPIFSANGTPQYILGITEDVTEQRINRKLDMLFSTTRHDILNQLTAIMSYSELGKADSNDATITLYFERILEASRSIRSQVAFTRTLQDIGVHAPQWQPVRKVFVEAVRMLSVRNLTILNEVDAVSVYADPLLPKVFYNLLENSLRYGGPDMMKIRLWSWKDKDTLTIVYEDDGVGIPVAEKEKVFKFGYGKNTGLGLYLIREILGVTGITVSESGEPGRGVRFVIRVPKERYREP